MNKIPKWLNYEAKDGYNNISVIRAEVLLFEKRIELYHVIDPTIFQVMVKRFNDTHPNLQDDGENKQKMIHFINKRLRMRVVFKSKEAFARHFGNQASRTMKKKMKQAHGDKNNSRG